ncbi:MAG TPA: malonic semialdehyde reductase [Propionibacteriaceae bacterium]
MTQLDLSPAELDAFEAEFAAPMSISPEVQDLLFRDAHTANAFSPEPVSEEQMRAVYELIKWGPTAMNAQPMRIVLVRTPEAHDRLVQHMAEGNKAKTAAAPLVAVLAADVDFHDEFYKTFPAYPGARDAFADEAPRTVTATLNTSLQIGYFIIGLRAAGLAAGPMAGFDAAAVSQEFFPDGRHQALLVVNIGQATAESFRPRQPRLEYADVVTTV